MEDLGATERISACLRKEKIRLLSHAKKDEK